jgi:hypothetical protein
MPDVVMMAFTNLMVASHNIALVFLISLLLSHHICNNRLGNENIMKYPPP